MSSRGEEEVEFRILGPLEATHAGRMLELGAPKQQALLGVLLLHANQVVPVERLVDDLWGESPPSTAVKLVQGYVSALRKVLGEETIVTRSGGYVVRVADDQLDAAEFRRLAAEGAASVEVDPEAAADRLRQALSLWRGAPLVGLELEASGRAELDGLAEERVTALERRIDAELALGRHADLASELQRLVADNPYRERPRAQLMLALYRSGRQAEALEAFNDARRVLTDELGLEPSAELKALQAAILAQDESVSSLAATTATPRDASASHDELRPVTILFADIVGSTGLGEQLEPDEVKALVGECVSNMGRAVEEYGGIVQAYQGDGICAYFGVPQAHEDDPERAARTGLRILEVTGDYARDVAQAWGIPDFNVRVGINTGHAGVGVVGGADEHMVALGDATNVAARIQAAARPGTIAVGAETARRLAHRFSFEPVGDVQVKGREGAVEVATLTGLRAPLRARKPRALVGREHEVAQLQNVVSELRLGRGQVLLVAGEPGIGKTRLLAELRMLAADEVTWLEGQCLSYGGLPSWPFVDILRRWLGVEVGEAEVVVRTRARARLPAQLLDPLGRLLRIHVESERGIGTADEIPRGYLAWIESLASERPVVVAIEDLHWAHASSRELAEALLELTDRAPLLLVATMRRDSVSEGWRFRQRVQDDYSHRATELSLPPLTEDEAGQLLATLLPGTLEDDTRAQILKRAEGNPLYLEELLRALLESGGLERHHRTWTTTLRPVHVLPPALENLLVARIDRLAEGPRRLAQIAAVLGREFAAAVLERVAGPETEKDLRGLLRAEIVRELRRYPELVCGFRHGLLQEAALSTVTPARRRELAGRAATAVEELYAGSLDDHLERLAHYHAQAENPDRAREYLERAADHAAELDAPSRVADLRAQADRLG